jgi:hypothetical protein
MEHSKLFMFTRPARISVSSDGILDFRFTASTADTVYFDSCEEHPCQPDMFRPVQRITTRGLAKAPRLGDFVNLASASDQDLVKLALKHGPLRVPALARHETVDFWRWIARVAGCIIAEGRALCSGAKVEDQDHWDVLAAWAPEMDLGKTRKTKDRQLCLMIALEKWFDRGEYALRTRWVGGQFQTCVAPQTLFSAIGLMIADEIADHGAQHEKCFECGKLFKVKRLLPGKRRFCRSCGRRAAMKHLMRERRGRGAIRVDPVSPGSRTV